jgi:hypothetical protein
MAKKNKDKKAVKMTSKEAKVTTEEGTAMGEALKKAGFDPEHPEANPVALLTTYEVKFTYEGLSGKKYDQTSLVSECKNASDAQETVKTEIIKRGLNPDKLVFEETNERPDLNKEVALEVSGQLFPEPEATPEEEVPQHRICMFNGKIASMPIKNGDTRLLQVNINVGTDIPNVVSELLKFNSSEFLHITIEPMQLDALVDRKSKKKKQDQPQVSPTKEISKPSTTQPEPEMLEFMCIRCGVTFQVDKNNHGKDATCPSCDKSFPIEFEDEDPAKTEVEKAIDDETGINAALEADPEDILDQPAEELPRS